MTPTARGRPAESIELLLHIFRLILLSCVTYLQDIVHSLRTVNSYIARKQTYNSFVKRKCFIGIMRSILLLASFFAKFFSRVYPQIPLCLCDIRIHYLLISENKLDLQKFSVGKNEVGNFRGCLYRLFSYVYFCIKQTFRINLP